MTRHAALSTDPSMELAQHDAWFESRKQPCFAEAGYDLFLSYYCPPSQEGIIWQWYRDLSGDRALIIVPMGGAIPGAIPYTASQYLLETEEVDPDEWEFIRDLWRKMDSAEAEERQKRDGNK